MQDNRRIPLRKSAADQALDQAVKRIYEIYGPNLGPFFAAVQKQRMQLQEVSEMREGEATREAGS